MTEADFNAPAQALRQSAAATFLRRDVITAEGPETMTFLQGQLSQDVSQLAVGAGTYSFVLQPHGKVDAFIHLARVGDESVVIQVDEGYGKALVDRLERFKLRTKVDFAMPGWKVLAVRGPLAGDVEVTSGTAVPAPWRAAVGVDVVGEAPAVADVAMVDSDTMDAYRIELGVPQMGRELDERTIPAEAGINDLTISFTKGCYTGQELVARIDSRGGNVPRLLRGIVMEIEEPPPGGAKIMPIGNPGPQVKPLGAITSSAYSSTLGAVVALAYIRRDALAASEGVVQWDHGPTPCRISALPIPS